ncbi:hypothetical protein AURDEDRAFT_131108 [Auricularia subglabra TFB-10046 SS5]|uniref:Uncharacterized protein n=1 Tax=Auricularia subglabra (strain TFB-10046 / SS5) TaxID=717982 RepID=J0CVT4_AURST|nr:hypothetical protein AURDEDRAFT_131108 [Auricularia subglabra TFB-10046 SS5]
MVQDPIQKINVKVSCYGDLCSYGQVQKDDLLKTWCAESGEIIGFLITYKTSAESAIPEKATVESDSPSPSADDVNSSPMPTRATQRNRRRRQTPGPTNSLALSADDEDSSSPIKQAVRSVPGRLEPSACLALDDGDASESAQNATLGTRLEDAQVDAPDMPPQDTLSPDTSMQKSANNRHPVRSKATTKSTNKKGNDATASRKDSFFETDSESSPSAGQTARDTEVTVRGRKRRQPDSPDAPRRMSTRRKTRK